MTPVCLPPHPAPSAPALTLPPGATDGHAHVFGDPSKHPFVADRSYTPPPVPLSAYQALHRALGIERAVIVQPSVYGTDNTVTLDAMAGYGPNARGVAVVDPDCAWDELVAMNTAGMRGVRINTLFAGGVGLAGLETTAARIAELGWHVQLLIDGPTLVDLEGRLAALPVPVVIDHMGHVHALDGLNQPGFMAQRRLVARGNTWVKLSGN